MILKTLASQYNTYPLFCIQFDDLLEYWHEGNQVGLIEAHGLEDLVWTPVLVVSAIGQIRSLEIDESTSTDTFCI